jgi:hypothetical protein
MKMDIADVVWTPHTALCRVEAHGSHWQRTPGDKWMPAISMGEMGEQQFKYGNDKLLAMFILFNTIVVRDGVDVAAAHQAFLKIDEYRQTISPDTKGAD